MNLKIAVIAENRRQFESFVRTWVPETEREKYVYATRNNIRGIRFLTFIEVGHPGIHDGYQELLAEVLCNIVNPDV